MHPGASATRRRYYHRKGGFLPPAYNTLPIIRQRHHRKGGLRPARRYRPPIPSPPCGSIRPTAGIVSRHLPQQGSNYKLYEQWGNRLENAVLAFFLVVASSQIYPPFLFTGKIITNSPIHQTKKSIHPHIHPHTQPSPIKTSHTHKQLHKNIPHKNIPHKNNTNCRDAIHRVRITPPKKMQT